MMKAALLSLLILCPLAGRALPDDAPNVILIMTDDQGWSHLSGQGHPVLKTPRLDRFAEDAVRLTDFHQELLCGPSRAALMTGRYSVRTGAWRTSAGRAIMRPEETTVAELFRDAGYRTAHFGKWHLGDNYPARPEDQGFEEVVWHKCGGVGQLSDYWGNDYFDDTYYHNGEPKPYEGYCADVWFNETMRFIKSVKKEPFFIYLASNTPHSPYNVAPEYVKPFLDQGVPKKRAQFYGMISNVDENMGRLLDFLDQEGLSENTILVFTTDDGASGGAFETHDGSVDGFPINGFNAGLRGRKASAYEGGHRTFCFFRWPNGKLQGGKDKGGLTAVWDVLPTLADLCGIKVPENLKLDGRSLKPLLYGEVTDDWTDRSLFVQLHGGIRCRYLEGAPHPYIESAVIKGDWRLVHGDELYNLKDDPRQEKNLYDDRPEKVEELKKEYMQWYADVTVGMNEPVRIVVGSEKENPVELTTQDSYTVAGNSAASVHHVLSLSPVNAPWKIKVAESGRYSIKASRYPVYTELPMGYHASKGRKDLDLVKVRLKIGDQVLEKECAPGDVFAEFNVNLKAGDMDLQGWMIATNSEEYPTYFVLVEKESR